MTRRPRRKTPTVEGLPPTNIRNQVTLLGYLPGELSELPEWFAGLTDYQFRRLWVAAIIDALERESVPRGVIRGLAVALVAVAERRGER